MDMLDILSRRCSRDINVNVDHNGIEMSQELKMYVEIVNIDHNDIDLLQELKVRSSYNIHFE